jgi:hypothetical protein
MLYIYNMPLSMLEPIAAGVIVALINKMIISNNSLWSCCQNNFYETFEIDRDDISTSTASNVDAIETHAHF